MDFIVFEIVFEVNLCGNGDCVCKMIFKLYGYRIILFFKVLVL